MNEAQAVTTHVSSNHIDLAIAGWLDAHSRSAKTLKAYVDTINQFRAELLRIGQDLDSDVRTIAMVAQRFASFMRNPHKEQASKSTRNVRLAILSSFYDYALARYLLAPMDVPGISLIRSRSCHVRRSNHTRGSTGLNLKRLRQH